MKISLIVSLRDPNLEKKRKEFTKILSAKGKVDQSYFHKDKEYVLTNPQYTYKLINKIVTTNDIFVVENTLFNTGISLVIGRIMEMKKPILVLVNKDEKAGIDNPGVLKAHTLASNKFFYSEYTMENLKDVLEKYIADSKKLIGTKYLFNLPSEMWNYLQWTSHEYNQPMVDTLRSLLDTAMEKDKEWQKHLSETQKP